MRKLVASALVIALAALTPAVFAQTAAASFSGKWEGTMIQQRPDGTESAPNKVEFNLTQNARELTGTAGPPDQQVKIDKGVVNAGKATFEMQSPNGVLFKFTLSIVKGRLQREMTGERDGVVRGHAKIDTGKAAAKK
jgi:hypothetical protein